MNNNPSFKPEEFVRAWIEHNKKRTIESIEIYTYSRGIYDPTKKEEKKPKRAPASKKAKKGVKK